MSNPTTDVPDTSEPEARRPGQRPRGLAWVLPFAATSLLAGMLVLLLMALAACGRPQPGASTGPGATPPSRGGGSTPGTTTSTAGTPAGTTAAPAPGRSPIRPAEACPLATVTVGDASALAAALARARPGDSIRLNDGVYEGRFAVTTPGTAAKPVHLCGGAGAVLDGGGTGHGYALHLHGADHWRLTGFTVRNAQKGVMFDGTSHAVLTGLTVEHVGDEAIHLRAFSSDNVVQHSTVRATGLRKAQFGEGVYVGTAAGNWCDVTGCEPDRSDRNIIRGNRISAVTAEPVDVKEGTTGGTVEDNTFDGAAMTGSFADSWVDVKGNGWLIRGNTGRHSRGDGFQTHRVADGWGDRNVFTRNTADVAGPGWGFHLAPVAANIVGCDNTVTGATKGLANTTCRKKW
ncbi:right-handed parallel beta-helix repeat-containing protein [Catellatospora sichuanensis]|uniref:right-handed parallel beta-helix repeat-containing protein n=1 Tax=Catellatospora sichuanensis TaxID=1969805 RepID=UPI001FE48F30|nr:right-handed parallel beta-helix repeat-containing protein [Catellatospora sichuanensis]